MAIAAVTATLRKALFDAANEEIPGAEVTARPLDRAREGNTGKNQLNLFLYRTTVDAALRNTDMPTAPAGGSENGSAPLPLTLQYLVTAWGAGDDDELAHRLLGRAMRLLHGWPVLGRDFMRQALATTPLAGADLHLQPERVRLTGIPLSVDEMSRLWTTFQTQYRVSAAFEVSVVVIESSRAASSPPPVVRRGEENRGPQAAVGPFPTLDVAEPVADGPSTLTGEDVLLRGSALTGADAVRFRHPLLEDAVEASGAAIVSASDTEVRVTVPAALPAGVSTAAAIVPAPGGGEPLPTNEVPVPVAPDVSSPALPVTVARGPNDAVSVTLGVRPDALPAQRAYLLAGSIPLPAAERASASSTLSFDGRLAAGEYALRLRVDGVDSPLLDPAADPPAYDPDRRLIVT
ncbi:MAG TPA: Pvc16 family protein [Thermoleophilaceae bacterium]